MEVVILPALLFTGRYPLDPRAMFFDKHVQNVVLAHFALHYSGEGFLGSGATFAADFNLVAQFAMAAALIAGVCLARQKRYRAHGICQTTVLLLNLFPIAWLMWPRFQQQVGPHPSRILHRFYYAAPALHGVFGAAAEILGLYIVLVARTEVVPMWLRFRNWKRWMRTEFVLWLIAVSSGAMSYYDWYIAPFVK